MPTARARFRRRFLGLRPWTRHSVVLMVAGLIYIAYGISLIAAVPTESRSRALSIALAFFPIGFWGTIWILVGAMSIISSRWPPVAETWGYVALTGLSAGWSAVYFTAIVFDGSPTTNFSGVLVWGLVAFLWWAISGLLNPDHTGVKTHG